MHEAGDDAMPNGVRNEKSQDEYCEPDQGGGHGVLFKRQIAIMTIALRPRLKFGLGCPLTILGFADVGTTETRDTMIRL